MTLQHILPQNLKRKHKNLKIRLHFRHGATIMFLKIKKKKSWTGGEKGNYSTLASHHSNTLCAGIVYLISFYTTNKLHISNILFKNICLFCFIKLEFLNFFMEIKIGHVSFLFIIYRLNEKVQIFIRYVGFE